MHKNHDYIISPLPENTVSEVLAPHHKKFNPFFDQAVKELNPEGIPLSELKTVSFTQIYKRAKELMQHEQEQQRLKKTKEEEIDELTLLTAKEKHEYDDIPF